jgi:hypothetical protein
MSNSAIFDDAAYGPRVQAILEFDGKGRRLMPLAGGTCSSEPARQALQGTTSRDLFPRAHAPEAALAGLYLYFSCLDESHAIAQSIETAEGSFWHGIMHRQEPDAGNAAYWFRRAGQHPIFPALRDAAEALGYAAESPWNPFAFIEDCDTARQHPGTDREQLLRRVQLAEWQLLFDYCARERRSS